MLRAVAAAALGLTGVASLVACDNGVDPKPGTLTPMPTTSPVSTTTGVSTPPPNTATPSTTLSLTGDNVASVETFVRDFFAAYNEAKDTRDLSVFEAMYLPQCERCVAMRDELAAWLAGGSTITGGDWHVIQTISTAFPNGGRGDFTALAYRDAGTTTSASGSVTQLPEVSIQVANGVLRPGGNPWVAEGIAFMEPPS